MTGANHIDVVRRLYRAVAEQDHDAVRLCLAEDVRWQQAWHAVPGAGEARHGADAVIEEVIMPFEHEWDGFAEIVDRFIDAGRHVITTGSYRGTYLSTGCELDAGFCHIWTVGDGTIEAFQQFTDTEAFRIVTAGDDADAEGSRR